MANVQRSIMEHIEIDRNKVKHVLSVGGSSEKVLIRELGINHSTYWRRFQRGKWTREQVMALLAVLRQCVGRKVREPELTKEV
jgi:alpha-galactosidase/6-phospho-beta-glucosidase family protein